MTVLFYDWIDHKCNWRFLFHNPAEAIGKGEKQVSFDKESKLMKFMLWLSDMAHLQLLWLAGTFAGLVIGGFFPATVAIFAVLRRIIRHGRDFNFTTEFWNNYKENILDGNLLGYLLLLIGMILVFYTRTSIQIDNGFAYLFLALSFGLMALFILSVVYIFTSYVHFDLSMLEVIRHAIIIMFLSPLADLKIIGIIALFGWSASKFPVLVPFVSIAVFCYFIMRTVYRAIEKITGKAELDTGNRNA